MQHGICKLCLKVKNLQDTHLIPRALYDMSRDPTDRNPHPVIITGAVIMRTSRQVKDYVLCRKCEQLFNDNGERWMMSKVYNGQDFPLLDRLNVAPAYTATRLFAAFSGRDIGIETEKLGYFVLSVLWRAGVHKWKIAGKTTSIKLGAYEEPVRKYLLGKAGFPSDVVVHATVCTDFGSQGLSYVPGPVPGHPYTTFALLTRGVYFRVLMGSNMPPEIRELCCVLGPRKPIFMANCESQTLPAFGRLQKTAKIARNLQGL